MPVLYFLGRSLEKERQDVVDCETIDISKILKSTVKVNAELMNSVSESKSIHVGFGVDHNFVRPMGVAITSLAMNNTNTSFVFHVFISSITDDDKVRLGQLEDHHGNIRIIFYEVNQEALKMLPVNSYFPIAVYYRLVIPLVLSQFKRILYLDGDVLCLGRLDGLYDIDMGDTIAAVVPDLPEFSKKRISEFSLKHGVYFNSGVMLINIPKWNTANVSEEAVKVLLESPDRYFFLDQDALNIVLDGKIITLLSAYNLIIIGQKSPVIPPDTIFLHCAGTPKPWQLACMDITQPLFLKYLDRSPWSQTPLILPKNYREARLYSKKLFSRKRIIDGCCWFFRYLAMKYKI